MGHPAKLTHAGETAGFLQAIASFAVALLVMAGFGGTVYKLIAPGGWFALVFGRSLAGGMAALLALLMVGISAWLARAWIPARQRDLCAELFVYVFAGIGLLYAVELLMKGGA